MKRLRFPSIQQNLIAARTAFSDARDINCGRFAHERDEHGVLTSNVVGHPAPERPGDAVQDAVGTAYCRPFPFSFIVVALGAM